MNRDVTTTTLAEDEVTLAAVPGCQEVFDKLDKSLAKVRAAGENCVPFPTSSIYCNRGERP